jgi:hypothetical protein
MSQLYYTAHSFSKHQQIHTEPRNSTKTADSLLQARNCNVIGGHRSAMPNVLPPMFHSLETIRQFNLHLFTFPKSKHRVTPQDIEQENNICGIIVSL